MFPKTEVASVQTTVKGKAKRVGRSRAGAITSRRRT